MDAPFCYTSLFVAACVFVFMYAHSVAGGTTCYNSTIHASPKHHDVTVFKGAEIMSCEDGFGCSKTLHTKNGIIVGVTRGCGIFGCLGKSCFNLDGHRLCLYCCRRPNCNGSGAVTSELLVLGLSLVAGWLIRKHLHVHGSLSYL